MKTLNKFLSLLSLAVVLTSCGLNHNNFQRQKFTNLKSMKSVKESTTESLNTFIDNELEIEENDEFSLELEDPKVTAIKDAIDNGKTIVLNQKGKQYRLKNPIYDGFYNSLFGDIEEVDTDVTFDSALELDVAEGVEISEDSSFSMNALSIKTESIATKVEEPITVAEESIIDPKTPYVRPTNRERRSWPEATESEERESIYANKAKKLFGLSFLGIVIVIVGLFLLLIGAFGGGSLFLGIFLVVGAVLYFILMNAFAFINASKLRVELDIKKKRMRLGMRIVLGLSLSTLLWLCFAIVQYSIALAF